MNNYEHDVEQFVLDVAKTVKNAVDSGSKTVEVAELAKLFHDHFGIDVHE